MNIILKLIECLYKDGGLTWQSYVIILVIVVIVTRYLSKIYDKHEAKHQNLDSFKHETCEKHSLAVQEHKDKLENHDITIRKLDTAIEDLKGLSIMINKIGAWVVKQDREMVDHLLKKHSPYQITPIGLSLLEESRAKACVDENEKYFIDQLRKTNPLTAYDVEENAKTVLFEATTTPIFNEIKNYLYNSPSKYTFEEDGVVKSIDLSISIIILIMSVYLRDKYLEQHPF